MFIETVPAPQLRFLVVDDSEDLRDVVRRLVEREGQSASSASDGLEAIEILQRESFDVMLLDLSMPRMDGVEVVRWLRDNPCVAPRMRVVVISAWAGDNRAVLAELGVPDVMSKPLTRSFLRELVAERLGAVVA
jgi:CheY-like chemotaxis protein